MASTQPNHNSNGGGSNGSSPGGTGGPAGGGAAGGFYWWRRARLHWKQMLRSIVSLHGSPHAIALGVAIGLFIAFTPTVGLQMVLAAILATMVGANRPAAIIPVWITNPVTIPPMYAFCYWVGTLMWDGPPAMQVYHMLIDAMQSVGTKGFLDFHGQFKEFLQIGADVFIAMTIGGCLIGAVCAVISYPVALASVKSYRRMAAERRARRLQAYRDQGDRVQAAAPVDSGGFGAPRDGGAGDVAVGGESAVEREGQSPGGAGG